MQDMKAKYPEARVDTPVPGGHGGEIWHEIVGTSHDDGPCARFTYVADKLIAEDRFRERTISVMQAMRERCYESDGVHRYRVDPFGEAAARRLIAVRHVLDGVGAYEVATPKRLVPQPAWMSHAQWDRAFRDYVAAMTNKDDPARGRRDPLSGMFGGVPTPALRHFELPARGVLTGHLVHEPLMGDLAHLLALLAAIAAANYQDAFYRAAEYVGEAIKTPPIVARNEDGGFHLIHLCRD